MKCPSLAELPEAPKGKIGWPWTEESEPISSAEKIPKISIVTPSFNQGEFIEETIRGVLLQGYPDIEYIICDGGSTDETLSIIKKYEKWVSFWVSEPDNGQSDAINKGFGKCTGEIVAWINSDDFYEKDALWKVAMVYLSRSASAVIYGNCMNFSSSGSILTIPYSGAYSRKLLLEGQYFQQPASFFNRKYLQEIGYIDEKYHYCMDYDMFFRLCEKGSATYVNGTLARFRYQENSKTVSQNYRFLVDIIHIFDGYLCNGSMSEDEVNVALTRIFWSAIKLVDYGLENLQLVDVTTTKAIDVMSADEWISYLIHWISNHMKDPSNISRSQIREIYGLFSERYSEHKISVPTGKRHREVQGYRFFKSHPKIAEGFGVAIVTYYPDMFNYRKRVIARYILGKIFLKRNVWKY